MLPCCATGAVAPLPKFTSHKVRQLPDAPDSKPYADLAAAYSSKSSDRLARVAEQHLAAFNAVSAAAVTAAAAAWISDGGAAVVQQLRVCAQDWKQFQWGCH